MYAITYSREADRALRSIPVNVVRLIRKKLEFLAEDPLRPNNNVTALQGEPGYRLRVGDWRVVYELEHDRLVVHVIKIGPRGRVYH